MKSPFRFLALAALGLGALCIARAVDDNDAEVTLPAPQPANIAPAEKSPILAELEQLVAGISAKMKAAQGELTAAQLSAELAQFDAIVKKYPDAKPEERAGVMWAKTLLYLQVLEDYEQAAALVRRMKTDFPTTEFATKSDEILAAIEKDRKAAELRKSLVEGAAFPGIEGKALDGAAVSTAALKGKIVLVDFWATWCPPCRDEIPRVLAAYEKYHAKGFEVLAVSLDQNEADLRKFVEEKKLPWPQIYEGADAIAEKFGIESIPSTYLLGADGKIIAVGLRGEALAKKLEELFAGK
jgi:thiol-disulfide isomerase/thioredoxin